MRMQSKQTAVTCFVLMFGHGLLVSAQVASPAPTNPLDEWFKAHNISIRKTFDGSKDEAKPASLLLVDEKQEGGDDHYTADIAVKIAGWEPDLERQQFVLFPTIEWHRVSKDVKPVNKLSGGLNIEYKPLLPGEVDSTNRLKAGTGGLLVPFFLATNTFTRDLEAKKHEYRAALVASLFSNKEGLPGGQFRDDSGNFRGRYYPYLGVEYFDPISAENADKLTTGLFRLYFEYWPVTRFVQFVFDGAYREVFNGPSRPGHYDDISAAVNFFLDGVGNIALGYEYQRGDDPKDGFKFRARSTLGLKFKFN